MRLPAPLAAGLAMTVLVLPGCGGGSGSESSSVPKLDVSFAKQTAITSASVDIFAAGNATGNIVDSPGAVARARQLLKPLIVANELDVGKSNPVAGGLVDSISSELDAIVPGLTKQSGGLDAPIVHSFLVNGQKHPEKVFEPKAASGVARLERLLHGLRANAVISDIGGGQTAAQEVASDLKDARAYWPDLAKRLEALQKSLR